MVVVQTPATHSKGARVWEKEVIVSSDKVLSVGLGHGWPWQSLLERHCCMGLARDHELSDLSSCATGLTSVGVSLCKRNRK